MAQCGEMSQGIVGAGEFFIGNEGDADFVGGGGCDVSLTEVAPVDLDKVCPWSDGIVLAKADAARVNGGIGEARPRRDARAGAIGADEVTGAEGLVIAMDERAFSSGRDALYRVLPVEADA